MKTGNALLSQASPRLNHHLINLQGNLDLTFPPVKLTFVEEKLFQDRPSNEEEDFYLDEPKKDASSMRVLLKEATEGDTRAMNQCCQNYILGRRGFPRDFVEAYFWAKMGYIVGDIYSEGWLGWCVFRGFGHPKCLDLGLSMIESAWRKGSFIAMLHLSVIFRDGYKCDGQEIKADLDRAISHLDEALARFGHLRPSYAKIILKALRELQEKKMLRGCPNLDMDEVVCEGLWQLNNSLKADQCSAMLDEEIERCNEELLHYQELMIMEEEDEKLDWLLTQMDEGLEQGKSNKKSAKRCRYN